MYYFLGILLAVIAFQFAAKSMENLRLDFSVFMDKETIMYIVSALAGAFFGGLFYVIWMSYKNDFQAEERTFKTKIEGKYTQFYIRSIVALAFGATVYMLLMKLLDVSTYDNLTKTFFTRDFAIHYLAMLLASTVFAFIVSIGAKKRLILLYGK